MEEQMSLRQFAGLIKRSDTNVRDRIKDGTISRGVITTDKNRPKIIPSIALQEMGLNPADYEINEYDPGEDEALRDYKDGIPDSTSKSEADRLIALYKAKRARLEYEEVEGNLINKGLVYSKLFDFAQQVRDKLLNVPDRVVDNVRAAVGRNQAIKIMGDEIASALHVLSDTESLEIMEKR